MLVLTWAGEAWLTAFPSRLSLPGAATLSLLQENNSTMLNPANTVLTKMLNLDG